MDGFRLLVLLAVQQPQARECVQRPKNLNAVVSKPNGVPYGCWMLDYDLPNHMWSGEDDCNQFFYQRRDQRIPCAWRNATNVYAFRPACVELGAPVCPPRPPHKRMPAERQ